MKEKIEHLKKEIASEKEEIEYTKRNFQKLQDLRSDIQAIWRDESSKELNSKYLDPCAEEDNRALRSLSQQSLALEKASNFLETANEHFRKCNQLSTEIRELLNVAEQEILKAQEFHKEAEKYCSASESNLKQAESLCVEAERLRIMS
jgi:hypothetical protein